MLKDKLIKEKEIDIHEVEGILGAFYTGQQIDFAEINSSFQDWFLTVRNKGESPNKKGITKMTANGLKTQL